MKKTIYISSILLISCVFLADLFVSIATSDDVFRQQVLVPQKVVQFDPRYYYGVDGYYALGSSLQRDKIQELVEQNAKLEAQLKLLIELLKNNPQLVPQPENPEVPTETPAPQEPADGVSALEQKVYDIFVSNCSDCHGGESQGRLQLVDVDKGQLIVHGAASMADIVQRVERVYLDNKKAMPPGGESLSDEDVQVLKQYMYIIADEELKQEE